MAGCKLVLSSSPPVPETHIYIVGRDELLTNLDNLLQQHRIVHLQGEPGAGRSAVASEYRRRYGRRYAYIWTLRASCRTQLIWDFVAIRTALDVPLASFQDQPDVVQRTRAALAERDDYLLIFEDVGHADDLRDFLPVGAGRVMLTTTGDVDVPGVRVALPSMTSAQLLTAAAANDAAGHALDDRRALDRCNGNPLAAQLLFAARTPDAAMQVGQSAALGLQAVLPIALRHVQHESAAAWSLLSALAWFNCDEVGSSLLRALLACVAPEQSGLLDDLVGRALVNRCGDSIRMHRSVQTAVLAMCTAEQRSQAYTAALRAVHQSFPAVVSDWRVFAQCAELLPHVERMACAQELDDAHPVIAARLLNRAALYLVCRSWFSMAEPLAAHAVRLGEKAQGLGKEELCRFRNNLGLALRGAGKLQQACVQATLAHQGTVEALGPLHPTVGTRANTLAMMHTVLGNIEEALRYNREAYHNSVVNSGRNDERYPVRAHNYGQSLRQLGRMGQGRRLLASALLRARRVHGEAHPRVAFYSNALGEALLEDGYLQPARHYVQAAATLNLDFYGDQEFMPKQVATDGNLLRLAEAERKLG